MTVSSNPVKQLNPHGLVTGTNGRVTELYRALMSAAETVVRAQTERQMLDGLCRLLVESGLFPQVWIGRPDSAGKVEILSMFSALASDGGWYRPNVFTGDENRIMTVRAWRQSKLQYSNDRLSDPHETEVSEYYRQNGLRGTAVVPLYRDGELWALLTLISNEGNIFETELLELLQRIGRLIGHGLDSLELRRTLDEERRHQSWLARHDTLTNVLNHRGLLERLEESQARSRRHNKMFAVAVVDLDGFKSINDLHGRPAGDLLLQSLATRLEAAMRLNDAVGRLGGDEFVVVLEDIERESDLASLLGHVQDAVSAPIFLASGRSISAQSSVGVTLYPRDESGPDRLLRHAERALFALKESKEDCSQRWLLFHAEADQEKYAYQKRILTLFRAGNLRIHYQPVVDLQSGRVVGVEALARLANGDGTLIPPASFIPQLGLANIVDLTCQVMTCSIHDIHLAAEAGFPLNVGVNLEPTTLADTKAMLGLCRQIESSGMVPGAIVLELLERTDTLSFARARHALRSLKTAGARIALDDVGSAYSSLLRVKELPIDLIKLDRTFLIGLERHPRELRFIMNLVHLVLCLGLGVVAEGIESDATSDALAAMGVHHGQGFAIARPMPFDDLLAWLRRHRATAWKRPTTVLGAVALQLCGLDATSKILPQRPDFLGYMRECNPDRGCQVGVHMNSLGHVGSRAAAAHREWHRTLADLSEKTDGIVEPNDFNAARALYEEELFQAALEAHPAQA